jgi:hypothetical protein
LFENHPTIPRLKGDWAAINILTNRYVVNVRNSFVVPFLDRQRAFVKKWLEHRDFDNFYQFDIICEINGWPRRTPRVFPAEVHELIKRHRYLLEEPQDLHPKNLHSHIVVRYYHELQCFYDNIGCARISLLPLCTSKRHFMTIDSTVLLYMLINIYETLGEQAPSWIQGIILYNNVCDDAIHVCRDEMWHKTFGLTKLKTSSKRRFDYQIGTDGVSTCFHFSHPKPDQPADMNDNDRAHFLDAKRIISIDPGNTSTDSSPSPERTIMAPFEGPTENSKRGRRCSPSTRIGKGNVGKVFQMGCVALDEERVGRRTRNDRSFQAAFGGCIPTPRWTPHLHTRLCRNQSLCSCFEVGLRPTKKEKYCFFEFLFSSVT